ncbi:MAG: hypothetical protein LUH14_10695 [Clostridiaceae bacterium]|nr:hypothetical protein [Clostridiaceae bacterium]
MERLYARLKRKAIRANNIYFLTNIVSNIIKIILEIAGMILSIILIKNLVVRIVIGVVSVAAMLLWAFEDSRLARVELLYEEAGLPYVVPEWCQKAFDKDAQLDENRREKLRNRRKEEQ